MTSRARHSRILLAAIINTPSRGPSTKSRAQRPAVAPGPKARVHFPACPRRPADTSARTLPAHRPVPSRPRPQWGKRYGRRIEIRKVPGGPEAMTARTEIFGRDGQKAQWPCGPRRAGPAADPSPGGGPATGVGPSLPLRGRRAAPLADHSRQVMSGEGFGKSAFAIDWTYSRQRVLAARPAPSRGRSVSTATSTSRSASPSRLPGLPGPPLVLRLGQRTHSRCTSSRSVEPP